MKTATLTDTSVLNKAFMHQLNRIYNGKCFLRNHLESIMGKASFKSLQLALGEFNEGVINQIARMEQIYQIVGEKPSPDISNPISSIVKDEFCLDEKQDIPMINDLDITLYVQILEHINITSYRMLMMLAKLLKYDSVNQLLSENMDESLDNDQLFALIANEYITKD